MKVIVAHPGTQYSYQLVNQLERLGYLYEFHTCFSVAEKNWLHKLLKFLPHSVYNKLSNRIIKGVPSSKVKKYLSLEFKTMRKLRNENNNAEQMLMNRNERFQQLIPDSSLSAADVVIGFDTSSWILAERCRSLGVKFILDVSIAHSKTKERIYSKILNEYPGWSFAVTIKPEKYIELERTELRLADKIVVASTFSKNTLLDNEVDAEKIHVNPYGVNSDEFVPLPNKKNSKIKFVFVGLVDARKGVPFLLDVWHKSDHSNASLTLIGPITAETKKYIEDEYGSIDIAGKISFEMLKSVLPDYDVLIFPSYFEGFGLVIPEAMACGLPVITTTATGGPDIFQNGREGFIIEPGNAEKLKDTIEYFIQRPEAVVEMGLFARKKAAEITWEAYGNRWNSILMN